jgi:Ca2+-binding RTX toxin-like protein
VRRRRFALVGLLTAGLLNLAPPATAAPPPHDAFGSAQAVPSLPFSHAVNTADATRERGEPYPPCTDTSEATVWYSFTPVSDVVVGVDTRGSDFDTVLTVYTGASVSDLIPIACDDDPGGLQARTVFAAEGGTTYFIQAGGYDDTGNLHITFREVEAAVIAGTVTEEGTGVPLPETCVSATDADFGSFSFTVTGGQGRYRLPVRGGGYYVLFEDFCDATGNDHRSEWYDNVPTEGQATRIDVSGTAVVGGIDAALIRTCPEYGLSNRAQLVGTDGPDVLVGTSADEVICGLGGADRITAGDGRDDVFAGDGSDRVAGNGGRDRIFGDQGKDRISAGGGNDDASGDRGADVISGGSGNDRLSGEQNGDKLTGGPGRDSCRGGKGRDRASRSCERIEDVP